MNKAKWLRCFLVSLVVALIAPFFTFTVGVATVGPMVVPGDFQHIQGMSSEAVETYLNSPHGTRKISGMEKFLFPFTVPGAWQFYLRGVITIFIIVFISCVSVTLWIARAERLA